MKKLLFIFCLICFPVHAGELTNFGATECVNAVNDGTEYLALFTAAPSDVGGGTEVSGSGYARQALTLSATSNGATTTTADVSFTASGGNFGTVTHYAVFDALTGGNMLWWGAMDANQGVNDGQTLTISTGDLDLAAD